MKIVTQSIQFAVMIILFCDVGAAQTRSMFIHKNDSTEIIYRLSEVDSITFQAIGTVTDIDGNTYRTVKIGDQWWMAENLKVTHYRNGETIPEVTDYSEWLNLSGAYCNYDNDDNNVETYGRLYNWFAVDDSRGIAPDGWHVPTDAEWTELTNYVGSGPGTKLKSTSGWYDYGNGTDDYNFNALPAGYRRNNGYFLYMGTTAYFWSSSRLGSYNGWFRGLLRDFSYIYRSNSLEYHEVSGLSVRCVRD